jgi:rSAM/selenodomain-associated transferase 2
MPDISVVIPVLNEAETLGGTLSALGPHRARGLEVIVVDGGSDDGTPAVARPLADRVVTAPRGRGAQMNAGAAVARGDVLLFLHADTRLPDDFDQLISQGLEETDRAWGRFDVAIEGAHPLLPIIATFMNLRSRLTAICTGDQAIFVRRGAFAAVGGYPDIALMEDIALTASLKRLGAPLCLAARVTTSGRRWEKNGVIRTITTMWWLRLSYFCGIGPATLARRYGYIPRG